jgi:hypothetical protein
MLCTVLIILQTTGCLLLLLSDWLFFGATAALFSIDAAGVVVVWVVVWCVAVFY